MENKTKDIIALIGAIISLMIAASLVGALLIVVSQPSVSQGEAKCTSLYGVYGSGKCYSHGEEIEL